MYVNQSFHYSYLLLVKLLAWFDAIILGVESHPFTRVVHSTSKLEFSFKRIWHELSYNFLKFSAVGSMKEINLEFAMTRNDMNYTLWVSRCSHVWALYIYTHAIDLGSQPRLTTIQLNYSWTMSTLFHITTKIWRHRIWSMFHLGVRHCALKSATIPFMGECVVRSTLNLCFSPEIFICAATTELWLQNHNFQVTKRWLRNWHSKDEKLGRCWHFICALMRLLPSVWSLPAQVGCVRDGISFVGAPQEPMQVPWCFLHLAHPQPARHSKSDEILVRVE